MSFEPLPVYRHSGKFGIHGPLAAIVAAVAIGFPLGFVYAYGMKWIPFVYVNFLLTAGYGFAFGSITGFLMKWAKVRNTPVALLSGLIAGLLALFFNWNAHIHALFDGAPALNSGKGILAGMQVLYEQGSWGLSHSGSVTGVPLAIVWVIEALAIIGLTTFISMAMVFDTPFCEKTQCWLDQEKKISTLQSFTDPEHLAALKAGDLGPLAKAKPKESGAMAFARLTLKHSPRTQEFCTVRVENVTIETKKGETNERTQELTRDIMVPPATFELLSRFESFTAALPAAA
jgi:hypothetical protein